MREPFGDLKFVDGGQGLYLFEDEEGTYWSSATMPFNRADLVPIPNIPQKPRGTMALISATMTQGMTGRAYDISLAMEFLFEDQDGHRWRTTKMPCFRFEMEYVPKS